MMDHHCSFLGGCIGHSNYKMYLLFVIYSFLMALILAIEMLVQILKESVEPVSKEANDTEKVFYYLTLIMSIPSIATLVFLMSYHIYFVRNNLTTIEMKALEECNIYSLGKKDKTRKTKCFQGTMENVKHRMGNSVWLWLVPVPNTGSDPTKWKISLPIATKGND